MSVLQLFSQSEIKVLCKHQSCVLLSGGPDSVFLFYQCLKWREEFGFNFMAFHANHGLRGKESDDDEGFVRELCAQHKVNLIVHHYHMTNTAGIQAKARSMRLESMTKVQQKEGIRFFLSAHHTDDFLETLVMKQGRGSGFSGAQGIRRVQRLRFKDQSDFYLLRPLLCLDKKFILESLHQEQRPYRIDASNLSDKYLRNRVRKQLQIPEPQKLLNAATLLQGVNAYLDDRVWSMAKSIGPLVPEMLWQSWPQELQFRYLRFFFSRMGCVTQLEKKHFVLFEKQGAFNLGRFHVRKKRQSVQIYKT
ncbi:MAG: tRNA lysidine(34) synthetase TilS [Deltaproteobacteria bacterium]|nr:tRNA lysidine(34) synthetase TilS [Deltaproteobacteria bacterium]